MTLFSGFITLSRLDDSAEVLSEFGLTSYEAKVYLSILQLGLTTASKIAKSSGIRREEVYRTLPKLEKAGIIERVLGRPIKVKALPLDDVLAILMKRKESEAKQEIDSLSKKKADLLQSFNQDTVLEESNEETDAHFTLLAEKDAVTIRIGALIEKAARSIQLVDSFESAFRFVLIHQDVLHDAKDRGVNIKIVTEPPEDALLIPNVLHIKSPDDFDVRYCEDIPGNYILIDEEQVVLSASSTNTLTEGKILWSDEASLVRIIQRDFNDLYEQSTNWQDHEVTPEQKLGKILDRIRPRDHVILVYDSSESKHNTLFSYIMSGIERGEAAQYICSEETPDQIRKAMRDFGLNVDELEAKGALKILPYTEMYIKDGAFNLDDVMDTWEKAYDTAVAQGFEGMRVTGEMSCFIDNDMVSELLEYEHALHTVLDLPMTAICAYSSDALARVERPIDVYSELVKAHGRVLFANHEKTIGKIEVRSS